jgi:CubicO group peptidase (beta-lactamase class C family)
VTALDGAFGEVDRVAAAFVAAGGAPGLAYGIVQHGAVLHSGGVGSTRAGGPVPDRDSVFRIASMTKSFTAAAILRLRDDGRLALDDPVRAHLSAFATVAPATPDSPELTIRHLLTMSAGLPTDDPWADRQESMTPAVFDRFLAGGLRFTAAPGIEFAYSNLGFTLLGQIVSTLTGEPLTEVVRTLFLEPLGMAASAFAAETVDPARLVVGHHRDAGGWVPEAFTAPGVFSAMAGLFSSVGDLASWVGWFTDAFPPGGAAGPPATPPLSRSSRREMQQLHRALSASAREQFGFTAPAGYGYGLFVEEDASGTVVGHPGGYPGFGSSMRWQPASGLGVVVLGNGRYTAATVLSRQLLQIVLDEAPALPVVAPWPETLAARENVERLLAEWGDSLADALFAENMDLDLPRGQRRQQARDAAAAVGFTTPSLRTPTVLTPAAVRWECVGTRGSLQVEISLTPQQPPLIQTLLIEVAA